MHLAVANGTRIDHIAQVDSTYLLGARDWTDIEIPPHSSALGKVLLAWDVMPRPGGRLETPTGHTLRSRDDLDVDLARVRTRGYAVTTRTSSRSGSPVSPPRSSGRTRTWSPPSGSPAPRRGSRAGSTSSVSC